MTVSKPKNTLHIFFVQLTFTTGKNLLIFVSKPLPSFSIVDGVFISSKQSRQMSCKFTAMVQKCSKAETI
jgi:hypothetical protein